MSLYPDFTSVTPALLDRFVAGDATSHEVALVQQWMAGEPTRLAEVDAIRIIREAVREAGSWDVSALSAAVVPASAQDDAADADARASSVRIAPPIRHHRTFGTARGVRRIPLWARVTAGIGAALLVFVAFAVTDLWRLERGSHAGETAMRTYTTSHGQRATIRLPDGSRAVLAPASQLQFSMDTRGVRRVELQGQAYFTVTHDPRRSFVVRTGNVSTRVLGTSFDVRHYATDQAVQVRVVEGKVAASGARESVTLTQGMAGLITDSSATRVAGDARDATAWTTGTLRFTDAPVPEVLKTVGLWYGYEFRMADSALAKQHVTIGIAMGTPAEMLALLKDILDVRMEFHGPVVTLHLNRQATNKLAPRRDQGAFSIPSEVGK